MPQLVNEQWAIELNQAMPHYDKEVSDATIYNRLWLSMAERRGLIKLGVPGSISEAYPVDWREAPVEDFDESSLIKYTPQDYHKWAEYGWKGKRVMDGMSYVEYRKLKGSPNTIVDRFARIIPKQLSRLRNWIGEQIYSNSSTAGHSQDFDGIETACSSGTCAVGDIVAQPSSTGVYQGLSTALAQGSGTWSAAMTTSPNSTIATDWPEGSGDPDYCYNSPKLANWSSNAWGTGKVTWESNCRRVLSRVAMWIRNTAGSEGNGSSLLCMLSTDLMSGFKNNLSASNMILTPHREAEELGFGDALNFEGLAVHTEYGCPPLTGYILDMDDIQLKFITNDIVESVPISLESDLMYKFFAFTLGNMTLKPRRLAKLYPYAAA